MNPGIRAFLDRTAENGQPVFFSAITIGELRYGVDRIRRRRDAPQADRLEAWFDGLLAAYDDRILPVDADVAQLWGKLRAQNPHNSLDKLIAATALRYDLTVVTRNKRDFEGTGVKVLNPFTA